nr:MAG TPA: hypothetical protein [Caudoviricetes sp.]
MSGAMWFLVVVVVSVVVSGSVGVILDFFLGDSKENVSEGGVVETSRDENKGKDKGAIIFDGGVVSAEYFRGYLDGHRDGSGHNDDALGMVALQQRCRDGYYAR